MKCVVKLTETEDQTLQQFSVNHKHRDARTRAAGVLATATELARTQSMTLGQIARHIEVLHGEPMPCALETLSVALRRERFCFKRNRFSLKKRATRQTLS